MKTAVMLLLVENFVSQFFKVIDNVTNHCQNQKQAKNHTAKLEKGSFSHFTEPSSFFRKSN